MLGDLDKLIVAKGFKKLPKSKKIAISGHTASAHLLPSDASVANLKFINYN